MKRRIGLITLFSWLGLAQAADTSFSLAGTTPLSQFDRVGIRAYVQTDLGVHLTLGGGYAQSEPQFAFSPGSLIVRASLPFQTSLNERLYPFVGVDQPLDADAIDLNWYAGVGVEQQWIDQWGGFLETRYQSGQDDDWHLQMGIRFWPGRAKRLDVRMRNSDPDQAADEEAFNGRIELSDVSETSNEPQPQPKAEPQSEPEPQPEPAPQPEPEPIAEPLPPTEPEVQQVLDDLMDQATRDLPDGFYVHLGFFRQVQSIQRYRNLVTDFAWGDELLVHYDERLEGYRIVIGPYAVTDARARSQAVRDTGMDAFIYVVPENPAFH